MSIDPQIVILSGPSGVGKTTIVKRLLADCELPLKLSISATTRPPRPGETHGEDYFFLDQEEFDVRRDLGEFLECREVFGRGYWYGTLKSEVETSLANGNWVLLEIDVEGAMAVFEKRPDAITILICPESVEQLGERLRKRGTETEEVINKRLARAEHELSFKPKYRESVVNKTLDQTVEDICEILSGFASVTEDSAK